MYKIVDKYTHDVFLGNEKAVIRFANDRVQEKHIHWVRDNFKDLVEIGCVFVKKGNDWILDNISNIELATKFLQRVDGCEVVDIGDILEDLKNNEMVLITQEE